MKNYFLTCIISCIAISNVFGQFNIGPKIGINTSADYYNDFKKFTNLSTSGSHFGIFGRGEVSFLFIQPELLYSFNQFNYEVINNDESKTISVNSNYRVDLPLMVGFKFFKILRIGAGPVFSVVTRDKMKGVMSNPIGFKSATSGLQIGAGIDVWKLILDLRYEAGASEFKESMIGNQFDSRPQQLLFSVGIKLF